MIDQILQNNVLVGVALLAPRGMPSGNMQKVRRLLGIRKLGPLDAIAVLNSS